MGLMRRFMLIPNMKAGYPDFETDDYTVDKLILSNVFVSYINVRAIKGTC